MKVVLCGPPRTGKSCMRAALADPPHKMAGRLNAIRAIPGAPYPYALSCCPDGEGSWFQGAMEEDPEAAARYKAAYKAKFTPERVAVWESWVRNVDPVENPLVIVDVGGITSAENRQICRHATHAILLWKNEQEIAEWRKFCHDLGLTVVAEIFSDYHGTEDVVAGVGEDGVLRGRVHHLERGEPVMDRPTIRALAEHLVRVATGEEMK